MGVKDGFINRGSFVIKDGASTRFWEDVWLGNTSLSTQYPSLYNIVQHKHVTVANVLSNTPLNVGFNRLLTRDKYEAWLNLVERLMSINLIGSHGV
jgi:hypothetical protein